MLQILKVKSSFIGTKEQFSSIHSRKELHHDTFSNNTITRQEDIFLEGRKERVQEQKWYRSSWFSRTNYSLVYFRQANRENSSYKTVVDRKTFSTGDRKYIEVPQQTAQVERQQKHLNR